MIVVAIVVKGNHNRLWDRLFSRDIGDQSWLALCLFLWLVMGRAKQKERERKRSAASCQRLDKLFAKKSKRVDDDEVIEIDGEGCRSDVLTSPTNSPGNCN